MAQMLRTFSDIYTAVMNLLKIQYNPTTGVGDTVSRDRIKRDLNLFYQSELLPYHQWVWMRKKLDIFANAYVSAGTVSVTAGSVTITLSSAPANSKEGHLFSIDGSTDVYRIASHTGGSTTATLEVPYAAATAAAASYKIWAPYLPLPQDCLEIIEANARYGGQTMTGIGLQEMRRMEAAGPKAEGKPVYYCLDDYVDPAPYAAISGLPASSTRASAGTQKTLVFASSVASYLSVGDRIRVSGCSDYTYNVEAVVSSVSTTTITYSGLVELTESATSDTGITIKLLSTEGYERQKRLLIYPAIYNAKVPISIDFTVETPPLEEDDDEPILPVSERVVLFWGALSYAYERERMPEESAKYRMLAEARMARMAGNASQSSDKLTLAPSRSYLANKRGHTRNRLRGYTEGWGGGSSSGANVVTGTASRVAVFGTDSELEASSITTTELDYLDGVTSAIQTQLDAKISTTLADGKIIVGSNSNTATAVTPSGDVTVSNAGVTAIGSNKVTNAMLAQVATATFKGRTTASTGNVEDLTATQATALLDAVVGDSGSGGTKGLVPAPSSGDTAAGKFLKANGTWAVPTGTGTVTSVAMTVPTELSVSGSPVTTSGTLAVSWATQAARTFLSGPLSGSAAAPTFKALTAPTIQKFTSTGTTTGYLFTISTSSTVAVNDTYTNNGNTYTVLNALSAESGQVLFMSGASAPQASGTLSRATGSGTSSITFTSNVALATYTAATNPAPLYIRVRMVGGGGGGAGGGSSKGAGGAGGTTAFGSRVLVANGGSGATTGAGASGGSASLGSGPVGTALSGGPGFGGSDVAAAIVATGGGGGNTLFGGAGGGGAASNGVAGTTNTGAGGAGGGASAGAAAGGGGGGGAGGFIDALISSPSATYYYCVGAAGTNGSAGTSGQAGAAGGSGYIEVTEYYQ